MRKIILFIAVISGLLCLSGISDALTLDEAIADVKNQIAQRGLSPKDEFMAVDTLERLTTVGVSVDDAYQLVIASFENGLDAKQLAPITRTIELVSPGAYAAATSAATDAVKNKYDSRNVVGVVYALDKAVKEGASPEIAEKVVEMAVAKGLSGGNVIEVAGKFGQEIKKGISPQDAMNNASRYASSFIPDKDVKKIRPE